MTNLSLQEVGQLPTCYDKLRFSEMLSPPPSRRHSGELQWKAIDTTVKHFVMLLELTPLVVVKWLFTILHLCAI